MGHTRLIDIKKPCCKVCALPQGQASGVATGRKQERLAERLPVVRAAGWERGLKCGDASRTADAGVLQLSVSLRG